MDVLPNAAIRTFNCEGPKRGAVLSGMGNWTHAEDFGIRAAMIAWQLFMHALKIAATDGVGIVPNTTTSMVVKLSTLNAPDPS